MESLKLFGLAIFQGIAEFLPISSSGHLAVLDEVLDLRVFSVRSGVFLHFGTLLAVIAYYRKWLLSEIGGLFRLEREAWRIAAVFALATIPSVIVYAIFNDAIADRLEGNVRFAGLMLIVTGMVLLSTKFAARGTSTRVGFTRAVLIGCAQGVALLPGISRSGSTISCARHLGIAPEKAMDFSFIMTIPILVGATVVEFAKYTPSVPADGTVGFGLPTLCAASAISAVVGYFAIRILAGVLAGGNFWRFGLYCVAAGLAAAILG